MNSLFIIDSVLLLLLFIDLKENDDLFDIQEERFLKAIKSVCVKKIQIWDIVFYLGASELLGGKVISGGSIDIFTLFLLLYHGPVDHRRAFQRIHATDFNKPRAPVSCLRVAQYPLSGHGDFKYLLRTTRVCVATCMHACTHVWVSRTQEKVHRSEGNRTVVYDRSRKSHDPIVESNAVLYNAALVANKDALNKSRNRYNSGKFREHARMIFTHNGARV